MKILNGDCLEKLKELKDNSIDTIITDPPYGFSFMGKKWDYDVPKIEVWQECLRVLKPGGTALIFAGSRTQHRMAVNVEDAGFILKDCIMWLYGSGFPKATDISKQLDKGHKRKKIGESKIGKSSLGENSDWDTSDKMKEIKSSGKVDITEPTTEEAKLWNGWKSHGLKPAYEPILVAMKPNEGTYANNALKWGVSGLNIDGGRIKTTGKDLEKLNSEWDREWSVDYSDYAEKVGGSAGFNMDKAKKENAGLTGRFPANILLDEEAAKMLDEQSGVIGSSYRPGNRDSRKAMFDFGNTDKTGQGFKDKGGASRFFYVAKASKSERNLGCENLEKKQKVFNGQSKDSSKEMKDVEDRFTTQPAQNNHPTVKPLKLMEYLCTLTKTPTGGIVLDPFAGSGTTGVACINTGRDYILIEREAEYIPIIEARLKAANKQQTLL